MIDVGIGNIESVRRALSYLNTDFYLASGPESLSSASHILLPGVGSFRAGMKALENSNLVEAIRGVAKQKTAKIMGICLGMQLLGDYSEEGNCDGLGLLPFKVEKLVAKNLDSLKVPHVGFSDISGYDSKGLFQNLPSAVDMYFTHSYCVRKLNIEANIASCTHGGPFVAAFDVNGVLGAQFHPEKSQAHGLMMLKNFAGS